MTGVRQQSERPSQQPTDHLGEHKPGGQTSCDQQCFAISAPPSSGAVTVPSISVFMTVPQGVAQSRCSLITGSLTRMESGLQAGALAAAPMFAPEKRDPSPWRKRVLVAAGITAATLALLVICSNLLVVLKPGGEIFTQAAEAEPAEVAIVPGALVNEDGTMSLMLADRVNQALALFEAGKVDKILVSGDHGQWSYDEPTTMRRALIAAGVPASAVFSDHAGFNTRATMQRAKQIFGVQSAIIVTQGFHMKRSLYLADSAGIKANGLTSDLHQYGAQGLRSDLREVASRFKAVTESIVGSQVTGGPPVPISGPARASWGPEAPEGTPPAGAPSR